MSFRVVNRTTLEVTATLEGVKTFFENVPLPDNATVVAVELDNEVSFTSVAPVLHLTFEWDVLTGPESTG